VLLVERYAHSGHFEKVCFGITVPDAGSGANNLCGIGNYEVFACAKQDIFNVASLAESPTLDPEAPAELEFSDLPYDLVSIRLSDEVFGLLERDSHPLTLLRHSRNLLLTSSRIVAKPDQLTQPSPSSGSSSYPSADRVVQGPHGRPAELPELRVRY
jgi:hypothetical protein